jgi:hypothetical protein
MEPNHRLSFLEAQSKEELIALVLILETELEELPKAQSKINQLETQLQECKTSSVERVRAVPPPHPNKAKIGRS